MIYTNQWLIDFIGANWMALIIVFAVFKSMFPNSKIISAIGTAFSNLFPVLRQDAKAEAGDVKKKLEING